MTSCRTCLSKSNLKQLFPDKNLVSLRAEQLRLVCGIKIDPNDGLSQLICESCLNLFNGALKLRELSLKSEEIQKRTLKTIKIELEPIENHVTKKELTQKNKNDHRQTKKVAQKRSNTSKDERSVRIEDFESSNDSDFMDNFVINDLESIHSNDEVPIRIEDYESNDSWDREFRTEITNETINFNQVINIWHLKEKELLNREIKKVQIKEEEEKLLSLAAQPYTKGGSMKCTLCSKVLRNVQNFKCHAKTHFEPQNACEECGKKFVNPSHMRYHQQRMHGKKKRLACSKCSYRAVDPLQLQNHIRSAHTGERPYVCDVCGDSFRMRANIAQHMRRHFGVRNLQCDRCPAMFRSRSELTSHQNRVHYLLYTYHCYLCPETYKRPASVKRHLSNVHGIETHQQLPIKCVKTRRRSSDGPD